MSTWSKRALSGSDQDSEDGASLVGGEARQARVRRPHLLGLVTPGLPKRGILRLLRLSNVMILPSTPWLQALDSIVEELLISIDVISLSGSWMKSGRPSGLGAWLIHEKLTSTGTLTWA